MYQGGLILKLWLLFIITPFAIKTLFEIVVTTCEKVAFSISETFSDPVISVSSQEKKNVIKTN